MSEPKLGPHASVRHVAVPSFADSPGLQFGMPDIALLASVRRPVVSSWRRRYASSDAPFPEPIAAADGLPLFDAAAVAGWLRETGRGNNPDAVADLAAFATVAGASPRSDRAAFEAVTGLLCLYAVTGWLLETDDAEALLDAAEQADPDDRYLYREIETAAERLLPLARYTNLLVDAAGGPGAAFEALMRDRFRSGLADQAATTVRPSALSLTARVAVELTARGGTFVTYSDPSPGSSDLMLAVLTAHGDRGPVEVLTPTSDASASRLVRRRLRAHDVYRERLSADAHGVPEVDRPVTHVTCLPAPGQPDLSDTELLSQIDAIAVQMDQTQLAVVLGPAGALCESLTEPGADRLRDDLLRARQVVAILRLPAGLVVSRSRQRLALWVLGPAAYERSSEAFIYVADLVNEQLTGPIIDDLVTDLVAATSGQDLQRAHAARYLHPVPLRLLTAPGAASLVERRAMSRTRSTSSAADLLIRASELVSQLDAPWTAAVSPTLLGLENHDGVAQSTVAEAMGSRHLRGAPGHRLRSEDVGSGRGLRVLGVQELLGRSPVGRRAIDQFAFARGYPSGRLTEPGDVVFCTSPRPRAMVDREGAAVVEFPARVLRVHAADPGGLHPAVLAADINDQPVTARVWRLWPARHVPDASRPGLDALLGQVARVRDELTAREQLLDDLTRTVVDGVTTGRLALAPDRPATPRRSTRRR